MRRDAAAGVGSLWDRPCGPVSVGHARRNVGGRHSLRERCAARSRRARGPPRGADRPRRVRVQPLGHLRRRHDRAHPVAHLQPVRVAEGDRGEPPGVDLQQGEVGARVRADAEGGELATVGKPHADPRGPGHEVVVRQDVAVAVDDEARAFPATGHFEGGGVLDSLVGVGRRVLDHVHVDDGGVHDGHDVGERGGGPGEAGRRRRRVRSSPRRTRWRRRRRERRARSVRGSGPPPPVRAARRPRSRRARVPAARPSRPWRMPSSV